MARELFTPARPNMELYAPNGWQLCSPASLRGHLVNVHLDPLVLQKLGLPLYDLGIAKHREIDVDWMVGKAIMRMDDAAALIEQKAVDVSVERYRHMVAKTLHMAEDMGLTQVPWEEVNAILPSASDITFDPVQDIKGLPFAA